MCYIFKEGVAPALEEVAIPLSAKEEMPRIDPFLGQFSSLSGESFT